MKKYDQRKVVLVGCGMVGMSYAYSVLNQNICDELVLIDVNKKRARGEANDLAQGLPFALSSMKISSGEYSVVLMPFGCYLCRCGSTPAKAEEICSKELQGFQINSKSRC
ncbi:MAG: lactate/malate family dehydrogenase [Eubacterium sp.]